MLTPMVGNGRLSMPEVSEVQTVAEDVVDLTVKAEEQQTGVEESATMELQQQPQPDAEEAEAEMVVEKVGEAPRFLALPQPKVVQEGDTVVFECELTGEPMPEVHALGD